jgi:transcriptional regulator with XRE-family HTH domain
MMTMPKLARPENRRALAEFVVDRRSRMKPEEVGLPTGTRRRTPGLRREEVAQLAGVGITWYTWFEQGRDIDVSADFLDRLCRAFRLSDTERSHLFILAQHRPPPHDGWRQRHVSDIVRAVLASLPAPAYIMTSRWDVVGWNAAAGAMFGEFAQLPNEDRNLIRLIFGAPEFRQLMIDWESDARRTLARFRVEYARAAGSPAFEALVEELQSSSREFRQWWSRQDVAPLGDGLKRIRLPQGEVSFEHAVFAVEGAPDLRLVAYSPTSNTARQA